MNEFQKFVMHVRNLQSKGTKQATFNVDYLCDVLEHVSPLPVRKVQVEKENEVVIADGGGFGDED